MKLGLSRYLSVAAAVLVGLGVVALLVALIWTPAPHEIHTPGATTITNFRVAHGDRPTYVRADLRPSLSLADMRCEASQATRLDPCPGAATLEQEFWPGVMQTPNTLYVSLSDSCARGFNAEFFKSNRSLIFHCYTAAPQINLPYAGPPGVRALPPAVLVLVRTDGIGPGEVVVIGDDRVEHPLGDDSSETPLGTVTIP